MRLVILLQHNITLTVTSESDGLSDSLLSPLGHQQLILAFIQLVTVVWLPLPILVLFVGFLLIITSFQYTWDFGDGSPSETTNNMTDENNVIQLSEERNVNIVAGLMADFEYYPDCYEVRFSDASTTCDTIQSYAWDFGDGTTSTESEPVHTYETVGPHTVTLTVFDGTNTLEKPEEILLNPDLPAPEFNVVLECDVATFTDLSNSCAPLTIPGILETDLR